MFFQRFFVVEQEKDDSKPTTFKRFNNPNEMIAHSNAAEPHKCVAAAAAV